MSLVGTLVIRNAILVIIFIKVVWDAVSIRVKLTLVIWDAIPVIIFVKVVWDTVSIRVELLSIFNSISIIVGILAGQRLGRFYLLRGPGPEPGARPSFGHFYISKFI